MTQISFLDTIRNKLVSLGLPKLISKSKDWMRNNIMKLMLSAGTRSAFIKSSSTSSHTFAPEDFIGHMFFFFYDAKLKKTLPYYDKFPLIIVLEIYSDGFLGLNLHYINPSLRAKLLSDLSSILNNTKYDKTTKFRISYAYLKRTNKILPKEAKPCIKRYLYSHVKSKFLPIYSMDWIWCIYLPYEDFTSQTKTGVTKNQDWSDSHKGFK